MADDKKKPAAAPAPTTFTKNHFNETMIMLVVLLFLGAVFSRVQFYFRNAEFYDFNTFWSDMIRWFLEFWSVWKVIAFFLIIAGIVWTIYSLMKLKEIEKAEEQIFGAAPEDEFLETGAEEELENEKWVRVVQKSNSDNPSDWRQAIIEADVMLEELLRISGYHGDGVGEMLKGVDPSDMLTLDAAWEAHKVRNRIAHAGADFDLTERETRRVISLFESVFREFEII